MPTTAWEPCPDCLAYLEGLSKLTWTKSPGSDTDPAVLHKIHVQSEGWLGCFSLSFSTPAPPNGRWVRRVAFYADTYGHFRGIPEQTRYWKQHYNLLASLLCERLSRGTKVLRQAGLCTHVHPDKSARR